MTAATSTLDRAFLALAHPARRAVVERLGRGPATVSELAEPFDMALPSFMQHLRTLEDSGLVDSRKEGRVRTVRIQPKNLRRAMRWLEEQQRLWERRFERLDTLLAEMEDDR